MARDLEDYTQKYQLAPFEHFQVEYRRQTVLRLINDVKPTSLLEIGCADRPLFTDLPTSMQITVVEPAIDFANNAKRIACDYENVAIFHGFFEDLNADQKFDMVILSGLLPELDDPEAALQAVLKFCASETTVHVNVPNASSLHRQLALAMGLIPDLRAMSQTQQTLQLRNFVDDMETLEALMKKVGFEVTDRGGIFVKPFTHAQMQELFDAEFLTQRMLDGLQNLALEHPELASEIWVHAKRKSQ